MTKKKIRRLYRSEKDRMIGGVCGGLAEYFNVDSVLIRVIAVVLALISGFGLLTYIILWIVMPTKSDVFKSKVSKKKK